MPWTKGRSGNPKGRPAAVYPLADMLRAAGNAPVSEKDLRPRHEALVEKLWALALAGDLNAIRILLQYTIGKPIPIARDQAELDRFIKQYAIVSPDDWPAPRPTEEEG